VLYKWQKELNLLKDRGRPRKHIDMEKLKKLLNAGYSCETIAPLFNCGANTLRRRAKESKQCQEKK
jgi:hypothetical protein